MTADIYLLMALGPARCVARWRSRPGKRHAACQTSPRRHRKDWPTDLIENIRAAFSEVFDVADDVAAAIKRELKTLETGGKG